MRVLISGDRQIVHMMLRHITRHPAYNWHVCGEAADGPSAISKAFELRPDLIVLHARMPFLDGVTSGRRIRAFLPESPIFICTSFALFRLEALAR
ncbi:MAG: response regulator [Candidatus Acidiferrales bacterium]